MWGGGCSAKEKGGKGRDNSDSEKGGLQTDASTKGIRRKGGGKRREGRGGFVPSVGREIQTLPWSTVLCE